MQTESSHPCRSLWVSGPWHDEPDKAQWQCPDSGAVAVLNRNFEGKWVGHIYTDGLELPREWYAQLPLEIRPLCGSIRHNMPAPHVNAHRQDRHTCESTTFMFTNAVNERTLPHRCELAYWTYFGTPDFEEWRKRVLLTRFHRFDHSPDGHNAISIRGFLVGHALGSPNNCLYTPTRDQYTTFSAAAYRMSRVMQALGNLSKDHTNFDDTLPPSEDLPWPTS